MIAVETLTGPVVEHGEGPVWSPSWGGIRWMDATRGEILTLGADGITRFSLSDDYAAFTRPRVNGGYVAVGIRHLYFSADPHSPPESSLELFGHARARLNEGGTDRDGRLFAGSMDINGHREQSALFLADASSGNVRVSTALTGVQVSNGIDFSPDGTLAYYVDSLTRRIDVFDSVSGTLSNRRPFVHFEEDDGLPDGLTVDSDESVWVAMWGGSCVRAYDREGRLVKIIELPVPQVTACTFGGEELNLLFITTSRLGLTPERGASDGSLYVCEPGSQGIPVTPFAG